METMTLEELGQYDGKDGRRAYTAYKGKIYDVTDSKFWKNGVHVRKHFAGIDLTESMGKAPHGDEVFAKFEPVALLEDSKSIAIASDENDQKNKNSDPECIACTPQTHRKAKEEESDQMEFIKDYLRGWYRKYHPHPITVHFPIALHYFAAFMDVLFFFNPIVAYEISVFYSFTFSTVGGVAAMFPGILSWWINYNLVKQKAFLIKLLMAIITLFLGIVAICQRWVFPEVAWDFGIQGFIYHSIIFITVVTVTINAYFGGKVTWS